MKSSRAPFSKAQRLVIRSVGNETVVYDPQTQRLHRLNPAAAAILRHSQRDRTLSGLVRAARQELGGALTVAGVRKTLSEMGRIGLLDNPPARDASRKVTGIRRRHRAPQRVTVEQPMISTLNAPTPMMAVSCLADGSPCTTNADCCNSNCNALVGLSPSFGTPMQCGTPV